MGGYTLELNLIDEKKRKINLGSTPFKVEEFLPDRIKIKAEFDQPKKAGWLKPNDLKVKLKLENMFGTVAAGNKTTANLKLYPALPDFSKYPDFNFSDPAVDIVTGSSSRFIFLILIVFNMPI